ncbi:hypothetical protein BSKO_12020 [Bryopsis sp. KO-2023]|nr:hypothetical protein BSKO_12020 [Bryopsis sp. KO-2023]
MGVSSTMWIRLAVFLSAYVAVRGDCCQRLQSIGFSSGLPVIVVDTWGQSIPDEPKIDASMCTCSPIGGNYDGKIGIEIRGSTSARDFNKKSFAVETREENGKDRKVDLFGMPSDSDWVLYGPEMDKSLGLRNILAFAIARNTGRYASRTQYCEVFLVADGGDLNYGHYNGVYVLAETVKKGKNRVDVQKSKGDLSGGFIFKHDNNNIDEGDRTFRLSRSQLDMITKYPKSDQISDQQIGSLKSFLDGFEYDLFETGNYFDKIDMGSFVDYFILTELTKNPDGYRGSTYMHKDKNGPLAMGPAWDYNEAFGMCCGYPIEGYFNGGNSDGISGGSAISTNGWRFSICMDQDRCKVDWQDGVSQWYRKMWEDSGFRQRVAKRWRNLRGGAITHGFVKGVVGKARSEASSMVERNANKWGINFFDEWQNEVSRIEAWTLSRIDWMDTQLSANEIPPFSPNGNSVVLQSSNLIEGGEGGTGGGGGDQFSEQQSQEQKNRRRNKEKERNGNRKTAGVFRWFGQLG